jgi:single-strand selective monofunctional uracil DNA glycosylase
LVCALGRVRFETPVAHVYNPLQYAREPHERYLARYGPGRKQAVLVGMNPGPWGMAQTGVPFGEVSHVRDWLGITGRVGRPAHEHPRRPVSGFECARSEVSGSRLWGWARDRFATPEAFFERFFVVNYCPLILFDEAGRNLTPDKLPAAARDGLQAICDRALARTVAVLRPEIVIGIGAFAEARATAALTGVRVGRIPHPSPASPAANRGWARLADAALGRLGIELPAANPRVRTAASG